MSVTVAPHGRRSLPEEEGVQAVVEIGLAYAKPIRHAALTISSDGASRGEVIRLATCVNVFLLMSR